MNTRYVFTALLSTGLALFSTARAQRPATTRDDTLEIELAVLRYMQPTLKPHSVIDDRRELLPRRNAVVAVDPRAPVLAGQLGLGQGQYEEVFDCGASCTLPDVDEVIAMHAPSITGTRASIFVDHAIREPYKNRPNGVAATGAQQYLLTRTEAGWRVTGVGQASKS